MLNNENSSCVFTLNLHNSRTFPFGLMKLSPAAYKIHADFQSSTGENCNAVETWIIVLYFPHLCSTSASVLSLSLSLSLFLAKSALSAIIGFEEHSWHSIWGGGENGEKKHSINQFFSPHRLLSVMMLSNNGSIHLGVGSESH